MRAINFRVVLPRLLPLLVTAPLLCAPPAANAAPARTKSRPAMSLEEVAVMLSSAEENEVRTALEAAATLPAADVVPMLDERVRAGLPRVLLDVAIDSLMLLDDRNSAPLLNDLARHRRPEVRARVLDVIAAVAAPSAEQVLTTALGDQHPDVRKAAADALGELGSRTSMPTLERALELRIDGAARALGRLARPEDVGGLLDYVGRTPLPTLTPMVGALLGRRDIAEADKLRSIAKVSALGGEEASQALTELLEQLPLDASPRVRRALDEAVQEGKSE